jgi:hypothetical protein
MHHRHDLRHYYRQTLRNITGATLCQFWHGSWDKQATVLSLSTLSFFLNYHELLTIHPEKQHHSQAQYSYTISFDKWQTTYGVFPPQNPSVDHLLAVTHCQLFLHAYFASDIGDEFEAQSQMMPGSGRNLITRLEKRRGLTKAILQDLTWSCGDNNWNSVYCIERDIWTVPWSRDTT